MFEVLMILGSIAKHFIKPNKSWQLDDQRMAELKSTETKNVDIDFVIFYEEK